MILRKTGLSAVIISLALLLSSCVEIKGDISVNSAARFNGELTYTLDKSFAAAAGISSLAAMNSEASSSEDPIDFCVGVPFIEDSTNYILKCSLKDALAQSGDITASVVGSNIVFRYRANLDSTSDQTNFGSVSLTVRFLDQVVSYKENKVGLVKKVDNLTYLISGYASELIDIEITANCSSRCGLTNLVPAPEPSTITSPTDVTNAAMDAANKAAAAAAAELKAQQEADAKAAAELKAKQEADAKAAAELKAKQEADAKAAAELKAKQEADAKAATEKAAAELKAKQEADAKAAAELKAKQEADAKAAADLKAQQEADAKAAAAKILAAAKAKAAAASKKTTITCVKGKLTKKVTAVKPVCPKGYTKKKK
jgi:Tfp pilus assembly protein FimV